ncbi:hypothetical protein FRC05_002883 [Tulasnella sp. 425]|nr:hypothetical protein FRC05_002883 [Tulasnella sp. 425]
MRIPSATGLVFASLALSGSSFAAPTPASPNPSSPNPGNINSPRPDIDSPRFPNSPSVGSPRTFSQATLLGRRNNRVRRPLGRKRSLGPDPSTSGPIPDGSDAVVAAPMQRSLAHMSTRDDGTVQVEGLGLIDQPTADTVKSTLCGAGKALQGVPGAGPALAELLCDLGETVTGVLGPNPPPGGAPAERRAIPHRMRRQASADAGSSTTDGTVNAEGLGLIPVATGKQLNDALHAIGGAVGEKVPIVGPVVGGLLGTVGDILSGLITRDHIPDAPIDAESLPASAYQQVPGGIAYAAASPYVGSTPGQVIGEFVGPDGRVYQEIAQPFSQAAQAPGQLSGYGVQHAQQAAGSVVGQASGVASNLPGPGAVLSGVTQTAGQTVGAMGGILPTGLLGGALGTLQGAVGGPVGMAQGMVNGVVETASGVVPAVGNVRQIIGSFNGLPVFSTAAATVQALSQPASGQVQPPDAINQFGQAVSGVHQTVSGMVAGSPAAGVVGAAQAVAGNIPVVSGMLGSLPIVGKDGNAAGSTFGILSAPNDAPAAAASPSATAVSSVDPSSPGNSNVNPSAESVPGNDGADEEDGDDDDGEDDQDSEEDGVEGKDSTRDNANSTSMAAPTSSTGSMVTPSSTPSASSSTDPSGSATQGTPTPPLPSSTAA